MHTMILKRSNMKTIAKYFNLALGLCVAYVGTKLIVIDVLLLQTHIYIR
jgi:hypothetical protein